MAVGNAVEFQLAIPPFWATPTLAHLKTAWATPTLAHLKNAWATPMLAHLKTHPVWTPMAAVVADLCPPELRCSTDAM